MSCAWTNLCIGCLCGSDIWKLFIIATLGWVLRRCYSLCIEIFNGEAYELDFCPSTCVESCELCMDKCMHRVSGLILLTWDVFMTQLRTCWSHIRHLNYTKTACLAYGIFPFMTQLFIFYTKTVCHPCLATGIFPFLTQLFIKENIQYPTKDHGHVNGHADQKRGRT